MTNLLRPLPKRREIGGRGEESDVCGGKRLVAIFDGRMKEDSFALNKTSSLLQGENRGEERGKGMLPTGSSTEKGKKEKPHLVSSRPRSEARKMKKRKPGVLLHEVMRWSRSSVTMRRGVGELRVALSLKLRGILSDHRHDWKIEKRGGEKM